RRIDAAKPRARPLPSSSRHESWPRALDGYPAGLHRRTGAPFTAQNPEADRTAGRQLDPEAAEVIRGGRERRLGDRLDLEVGGRRWRELTQQRAALVLDMDLEVDRQCTGAEGHSSERRPAAP